MEKIILAYCRDNTDVADRIDQSLTGVGIPFEHVTNRPGSLPGQFAAWVQSTSDPVILIVTDNFLKNVNCMSSGLEMVKSLTRHKRLITLVADGWSKNTGSSLVGTQVNTRFDRVVDAIQYLNYWQNTYLETQSKLDEENKEVQVVREIASQVGDFLNLVRDFGYMTLEDFEANDYKLFFQRFGIEAWYDQHKKMAHLSNGSVQAQAGFAPSPSVEIETIKVIVMPEEPKRSTNPMEDKTTQTIDMDKKNELPTSQVKQNASDFAEMDAILDDLLQESIEEAPSMDEDDLIDGVLDAMDYKQKEALSSVFSEEKVVKPSQPMDIVPKIESVKAQQAKTESEPPVVQVVSKAKIQDVLIDADYWFEKNDVEKGIRVLAVATEVHPDNDALRFEYAKALINKQHDAEEAQAQINKLLAKGYVSAATYDVLGDIAYAKKDYILAKNCWEKVAKLDPSYASIFTKLGDLSDTHFRGFKQQASSYYDQAIEQAPQNAANFYKKGALLLEHLNEPEKAARFLLQSLNLNPKNANAWSDLAIAYHHLNDDKRSDAAYKKAIELNPALKTDTGDALFLLPQLAEKPEDKAKQLTVLITGSTSGIGRATAQLFAEKGHRIILTGRRLERLESLKTQFKEKYAKADCHILNFDVRNRAACQKAVESIPEAWRTIDLLINNAGLAKGLDPIHEGNFEHWDTMIDTNLKGLLNMTRMIAPWMVARKTGHIINLGSSAGKEAYANGAVYCATKFGVEALTRAMRIDLHKHNIRVSQVSPGHVEETEFAVTRFDGDVEKAKIYEDFQPLKSKDVADAIFYIATRPPHVNIQDMYMLATQQASATVIDRSGR